MVSYTKNQSTFFTRRIFLIAACVVASAQASDLPGSIQEKQVSQKSWFGESIFLAPAAVIVGSALHSEKMPLLGNACYYGAGMVGAYGVKSYLRSWWSSRPAAEPQPQKKPTQFDSPGGRTYEIVPALPTQTSQPFNWNRVLNYGIVLAGFGLFTYNNRANLSNLYTGIIAGLYNWKGDVTFSERVTRHAVAAYQSLPTAAAAQASLQDYVAARPVRNFFVGTTIFGSGWLLGGYRIPFQKIGNLVRTNQDEEKSELAPNTDLETLRSQNDDLALKLKQAEQLLALQSGFLALVGQSSEEWNMSQFLGDRSDLHSSDAGILSTPKRICSPVSRSASSSIFSNGANTDTPRSRFDLSLSSDASSSAGIASEQKMTLEEMIEQFTAQGLIQAIYQLQKQKIAFSHGGISSTPGQKSLHFVSSPSSPYRPRTAQGGSRLGAPLSQSALVVNESDTSF